MSDGDRNAHLGRCGSYELLVELAAGGMATVFLARKAESPKAPLVAVKRPHRHLHNDKGFLTMLVDEARLASSIDHDNVVKVRELGFDGGEPFIVMDYVEGSSLADIRKELSAVGRAIDPRFAVRMTLDSLAGLQAAHVLHDDKGKHLGIVHRDVSPHNVLIGCDGLARITDFGIAKATDRVQATKTHEVKGKLAYLAPERIDKRRLCTVQSDVFSMAVVLWECIAGRRLFRGEEAIETLQEVVAGPIPSLRKIGVPISEALDDAILRGLSRDLDVRFKTAAEFGAALESAGGRQQIASHAEVAMLVEALFGERLRVRHEKIRDALPREQADTLIEVSGLNRRPAPTPEMRERERIAIENIAPPAPSARYTFGAASEKLFQQRFGSPRMRLAAVVVAVGLVTAAIAVAVVGRKPAPAAATPSAAAEPTVRRVIVPLPFTATRVTFDDQTRDLAPASDVAAFEVPRSAGVTHRVTALAVDGSRAEAYVREADGVARPEGQGFAIEPFEQLAEDNGGAPAPSGSTAYIELPPTKNGVKRVVKPRGATRQAKPAGATSAAPAASASAPKPIGSVKDGFTKLR